MQLQLQLLQLQLQLQPQTTTTTPTTTRRKSCGLSRLEVIEGVKELCAVYSVQCNVQCSESVCERLEAGGRRWQACRAKKQEPRTHTHSATGHNIALPRQTK